MSAEIAEISCRRLAFTSLRRCDAPSNEVFGSWEGTVQRIPLIMLRTTYSTTITSMGERSQPPVFDGGSIRRNGSRMGSTILRNVRIAG